MIALVEDGCLARLIDLHHGAERGPKIGAQSVGPILKQGGGFSMPLELSGEGDQKFLIELCEPCLTFGRLPFTSEHSPGGGDVVPRGREPGEGSGEEKPDQPLAAHCHWNAYFHEA